MNEFLTPYLLLIFLAGASLLTTFSTALLRLGKFRCKTLLEEKQSPLFLFFSLFERLFPTNEWENLYFIISFTKYILHILYAVCAFLFLEHYLPLHSPNFLPGQNWVHISLYLTGIVALSIVLDFLMRLAAALCPKKVFELSAPLSSLYLFLFFPLTGLLLKATTYFFQKLHIEEKPGQYFLDKDRLVEVLQDSGLAKYLDTQDQKMINSFFTFREKVAREIMVPRVDLFCLPSTTTIREATKLFVSEDYSRIPVYKDDMDNIIGVLLFKDVLKLYKKNEEKKESQDLLDSTLESMVKPVIYAPENKKIAHLFQELRTKQIHLAIIVNEYGGTEGIVTIEDILEEIVGDIEDEFDTEADRSYWKLPDGSWVVDAKMSIVDVESKLDVKIPHHPEYETIGGFVFHRASTIPSKGWKLIHDNFHLEVLASNERFIEKVRLIPILSEVLEKE
jgi:CBS domain containing-hemolysin-like protein